MMDLSSLPRLPGWEARLPALIEAARCQPYALGENDCFRLACSVVEALVGINRWPDFAGRYQTRRECLALLAEHGANFTEAGCWFFGSQPVSWKLARRGDLLEFREPPTSPAPGAAHLVVCVGARAVGLSERGIVHLPLADCVHAWRIG